MFCVAVCATAHARSQPTYPVYGLGRVWVLFHMKVYDNRGPLKYAIDLQKIGVPFGRFP